MREKRGKGTNKGGKEFFQKWRWNENYCESCLCVKFGCFVVIGGVSC